MTAPIDTDLTFAEGSLVTARGREWVVLDASNPDLLIVRPIAGREDDTAALLVGVETIEPATFPPPTAADHGDSAAARLLRDGLRIGFRSTAGPFRSLGSLAVAPRAYQFVPLMMALRQDGPVRLLIADGVGIGKTVEAGLIAAELLATGEARRIAVLCSPSIAPQWQEELRDKFGIHAELFLASTINRVRRNLRLNESPFAAHQHIIVSTDLIKQKTHRDAFALACPDLVIVDEAHTCVTAGGTGRSAASLRHELVKRLARENDPATGRQRHLLLLTATPCQGDDAWNELIGLLDASLEALPSDLSGPGHADDRARLARYFVQRQRGDVTSRSEWGEDTPFPERDSGEETYTLHPDYRDLIDDVVAFARETVKDPGLTDVRQRVRWWSAVALLRSLSSSPAAAVATLTNRARNADATSVEEADDQATAAVLDVNDDSEADTLDLAPGALVDDPPTATTSRRLREFAARAQELTGRRDRKLDKITDIVNGLVTDGYNPIVFCRYIPTAQYVADHLARALDGTAQVAVVDGNMGADVRAATVAELGGHDGPRVLIATDCLSEGVNLQEFFTAVVHYDLAWNPTRHEQREGRIDRFGQTAPTVKSVMFYGKDNPIDGHVLKVLIRRHDRIKATTGVSVSMPVDSSLVMKAVYEWAILQGSENPEQGVLEYEDFPGYDSGQRLYDDMQQRAETERRSRSRFAQHAIKPDEVMRELTDARASLGGTSDAEGFTRTALHRLNSTVDDTATGFTATLAPLPRALRDNLPVGLRASEITFTRELPVPPGVHYLHRADEAVDAIAAYTVDAALDPLLDPTLRPARRAGVTRTNAVIEATVLIVARLRFGLKVPDKIGQQIVEDAQILAYVGSPQAPTWLHNPDDLSSLLDVDATANVAAVDGSGWLRRVTQDLAPVSKHLEQVALRRADDLRASHRRVRSATSRSVRGLAVDPILPPDIVGIYVLLPEVQG